MKFHNIVIEMDPAVDQLVLSGQFSIGYEEGGNYIATQIRTFRIPKYLLTSERIIASVDEDVEKFEPIVKEFCEKLAELLEKKNFLK